ncbi:hypothetical protein [Chthonobacter rhizosphaerae]|uniref:hypothetical protein n=1 Tax=Chthonobacter rhizosphaerae TaxID=2735553 RepID=UPI0015EF31CA|nr:hypothetical protein [Chthonobacter rhizosphaerae]
MGLFRGLMVPISFVLFLAVFGATAVAVIAAGPISGGLAPADLPTLLPAGQGAPNPFFIAAALALVADLFIGMIAMLISERVHTVGGFLGKVLKTTLWFAVIFAGGLAVYLNGLPGEGLPKWLPALLLAGGLVAGAIVASILLGLPFLWWVSERPPRKRRRRAPPPPPVEVVIEAEPDAAAPGVYAPTAHTAARAPEPAAHPAERTLEPASDDPRHHPAAPAAAPADGRATPLSPAGAPPPPAV